MFHFSQWLVLPLAALLSDSVRSGAVPLVHHRFGNKGKIIHIIFIIITLHIPVLYTWFTVFWPVGRLSLFHARFLQLNAFDSRHLDEVYFEVRLTAFQDATRRVKDMTTLDLDYISTIIYNCFHTYEVSWYDIYMPSLLIASPWEDFHHPFDSPLLPAPSFLLMQIGDMSLADNATLSLSAVITRLAAVGAGEQIYKDVIQHTILDAVHKGLRSKTEVRSAWLSSHFLNTVGISRWCYKLTRYEVSHPLSPLSLPECSTWLHHCTGLPGKDLPHQEGVQRPGAAHRLQRPRVWLLRAHEAHPGKREKHGNSVLYLLSPFFIRHTCDRHIPVVIVFLFRSTVEVAPWGSWPSSWPRARWWWRLGLSRITSCRTPWPPC